MRYIIVLLIGEAIGFFAGLIIGYMLRMRREDIERK